MHKTTGAGHVGNEFVDEVPGVSQGTTVDEDWLNVVQREAVALVENEGDALDGGNDQQLWESIARRIAQRSKHVGEYFFLADHRAPSGWNPADPDAYFAGVCLNDGDHDIAPANYPDLVPYLLARALTYKQGIGGAQATHNVITWAVAAGVATLTFANLAPEIAILTALLEDEVVHGSYVSWRSITLAGAIGNILAGTYAITEVNAGARTVKFAAAVGDGGAGGAWTVQFFTHKIAGSANARVFERAGGVLYSANHVDADAVYAATVPGLRRRDRVQGHWHQGYQHNAAGALSAYSSATNALSVGAAHTFNCIREAITDAVNGTPRTGKSTDPKNLIAHLYIWAQRFLP